MRSWKSWSNFTITITWRADQGTGFEISNPDPAMLSRAIDDIHSDRDEWAGLQGSAQGQHDGVARANRERWRLFESG